MDKDTLKHILRWARQRKTALRKEFEAILGDGKIKAGERIKGRIITYNETIDYLERLLKEVAEAEAAVPVVGEESDD